MAKLFTSAIDKKLFEQYKFGNDLSKQQVVAKIFNPYGRGVWYLLNSDEQDKDYIWAIVDLFEVEVGSVSREDLSTMKVPPFGLPLERDMYFEPMKAQELYNRLRKGETFADGGRIDTMVDEWNKSKTAHSNVSNDDAEFFEKIGISPMSIGTSSSTGNDIFYYDTTMYQDEKDARISNFAMQSKGNELGGFAYENGGEFDMNKYYENRKKNFAKVDVIFKNPKYNYTTSINVDNEAQARDYFVGKTFDMSNGEKRENLQKAIAIKFYAKGTYEMGGSIDYKEGDIFQIENTGNKIVISKIDSQYGGYKDKELITYVHTMPLGSKNAFHLELYELPKFSRYVREGLFVPVSDKMAYGGYIAGIGGEINGLDVYESCYLYAKKALSQPYREQYLRQIGIFNNEKSKAIEDKLIKMNLLNKAGAINEFGKIKAREINAATESKLDSLFTYDFVNNFRKLKHFFDNYKGSKMSDGGYMARGGQVNIIKKGTEYKYFGRPYMQSDVWDRIKGLVDESEFAGNFHIKNWKHDGYLYFTDKVDKELLSGIRLKEGEKVFRYYTYTTAIGGMMPLIKINIDKMLAYPMDNKDFGDESISFITRGMELEYLNLVEGANYADGGYMAQGGDVEQGNIDMVKNQVVQVEHHAKELMQTLKSNPQVDAWVVAKMDRATSNLSDITHYLEGQQNSFADGGYMAKGGVLIASSPTLEGIKKTIGNYFYSSNIILTQIGDSNEYEVSNSKGKLDYFKVVFNKGRYKFLQKEKMADGGYMAWGGITYKYLERLGYKNDGNEEFFVESFKGATSKNGDVATGWISFDDGRNDIGSFEYIDKNYNDNLYFSKEVPAIIIDMTSTIYHGKMADGGTMGIGNYVKIENYPTFKTEEEAKKIIKMAKPFLRKELREGRIVLVYNGKEYFLAYVKGEIKMADGGSMDDSAYNDYEEKSPSEIWDSWSDRQRIHFLSDHNLKELHPSKVLEYSFTDLPISIRTAIKLHKIEGQYADGGTTSYKKKTTFDDKVSAIKNSLEGTNVSKNYQKEYGKTYDKKEALEAARRIAGAMRKKEKMKKGGDIETVENIDIVDFDADGDMNVDAA